MIPAIGTRGTPQKPAGSHRKKSEKFLAGIPLPKKSLELLGTGRFRAELLKLGNALLSAS